MLSRQRQESGLIKEQLCLRVNLILNSSRVSLSIKLKLMRLLQTQPRGDSAVAEEEELIAVANAPICEMDFSYQALSEGWHTQAREGWRRLTQGFFFSSLDFSIRRCSNVLPSSSVAMLFGDRGKLEED